MTIGSEYYSPMYSFPVAHLKSSPYQCLPLSDVCKLITDGDHGSADYALEGVRFVLSEAIEEGWIEPSKCRFITSQHAKKLPRSSLRLGDVLVTKTGVYFGKSTVVDKSFIGANTIAHVGILRMSEECKIESHFLSTFLNCKYGNVQLRRRGIKATRPEIKLLEFADIIVPVLSKQLQERVKDVVLAANIQRQQSAKLLSEASTILMHFLGLKKWTPPAALSYVRSSREAFDAERFDAEYFHPAKAKALADLSALSDHTVGEFFDSVRDLWQPGNSALPELVCNYDLNDALDPFLNPEKPAVEPKTIASTKKCIAPGDLVVSRLRSYLREIAIVLPGGSSPRVASTEFIVLRPKKSHALTVECLLIYLRSSLPQLIFKWSQDGSNHPRFDERELLNLPVPRLLLSKQSTYVTEIQNMIEERQRSARLLDAAKRAVEIAIEDSESAALAFLDSTT